VCSSDLGAGERAIGLVEALLRRGLAYEKLRSVYFDVGRDPDYGSLSHEEMTRLPAGAAAEAQGYVKDDQRDFTLLKRGSLLDVKEGEVWETVWGNVRPGWFLQMAATALEAGSGGGKAGNGAADSGTMPGTGWLAGGGIAGAAIGGAAISGAAISGGPMAGSGSAGSGVKPGGAPEVVLAGETHRFPHLENLRGIWSLGAGGQPAAWCVCRPAAAPGPAVSSETVAPELGPDETDLGSFNADAAAKIVRKSSSSEAALSGSGSPADASGPVSTPSSGGVRCDPGGLEDLLAAHPARAVRMWLLSVSSHKVLVKTPETLGMWAKNRARVQDAAAALSAASGREGAIGPEAEQMGVDLAKAFKEAVEDDLSLYRFWPALFAFCKTVQARLKTAAPASGGAVQGAAHLNPAEAKALLARLLAVDEVIRVLDREALPLARAKWPREAAALVAARETARAGKDFSRADALRRELLAAGFQVEDTAAGPRLVRAEQSS